jgi:hypothetical protein
MELVQAMKASMPKAEGHDDDDDDDDGRIEHSIIRRELPTPTGTQAFRAFAIAFSNNLLPEMGTTARLTLDYPLTFETLGDVRIIP